MLHRRRRSLGQLLFIITLILIFFFNRSSPTISSFAWTQVRYQTTAATLPTIGQKCPALGDTSLPALVVAHVRHEDAAWLETLRSRYHLCIYTADATEDDDEGRMLRLPANRGHEAMAYLTFLIENYESFPAAGAVFIHGSQRAWHNDAPDYDNAALLSSLNVSAALEPLGYHNLRCDWGAGTCASANTLPQGSLETSARALLEPFNQRIASDAALSRTLATLFGNDASLNRIRNAPSKSGQLHLGRADTVRAQCCAQFAVAKTNMLRHTRQEYIALRQWLLDDAAPSDDRVAGRILSYIWHILFLAPERGEIDLLALNTMACPTAQDCYCRLYSRCGLTGCTKEACPGQYHLPAGYRLPNQ